MKEKDMAVRVLQKFREEANLVAEQHVFTNAFEPDYPADVWSVLADAAKSGKTISEVEGVVAWGPFLGYSAAMVLDEMTEISDDVYAAMCHAVEVFSQKE